MMFTKLSIFFHIHKIEPLLLWCVFCTSIKLVKKLTKNRSIKHKRIGKRSMAVHIFGMASEKQKGEEEEIMSWDLN